METVNPPIPVKFGKNPFPKNNSPPSKDVPKHKESSNHDNTRTRVFSLVSYADEVDIMLVLSYHQEQIRYCCYILHDKDMHDDGSLKENHYHIVVETYNAYRVGSVRKWFSAIKDSDGNSVNTLGQPVIDRKMSIDYLTHEHHKHKAQYSRESIVNYNEALLIAKEKPRSDDDKALLILDDMIAGVPEYQLCRRYGREYIINAHRYRDMIFNILDDQSFPQIDQETKTQLYRKYYWLKGK